MIYQALIVDDEEIVCRGLSQFIKWQEHGFEAVSYTHLDVYKRQGLGRVGKLHAGIC